MKYNVYISIESPEGADEFLSDASPVEVDGVRACLMVTAQSLPVDRPECRCTGIRLEECADTAGGNGKALGGVV